MNDLKDCRVLLVNDAKAKLEIRQSQLTAGGYAVAVAGDGKEALERFRAGDYDLVLTNISMPVMDGYSLTMEIRRLESGTGQSTPIFAITTSDFELSVESARAHSFSGYMLKPLDPELDARRSEVSSARSDYPDVRPGASRNRTWPVSIS